jgi:peroxiredoxin
MLKAGAQAPSFELDGPAGDKHSLASILERGAALLVFYKVSCPVCQLTLPYITRIARGSLQVIAISQDDPAAAARFADKFGVEVNTLYDRDRNGFPASNAFGITHVPSLFVVEPDGEVTLAVEGFVKKELESLGRRAGVETFRQEDNVPQWKAG